MGVQIERRTIKDHRGHHPWRAIGMLPAWRVEFVDVLPAKVAALCSSTYGWTNHDRRTISILTGLSCAARRSTLTHETGHALAGPVGRRRTHANEATIERQASRLLLPSVKRIGHALAWHRADHERTAHELWVDDHLLHARLSTLTPKEREYLDEQLATVWV